MPRKRKTTGDKYNKPFPSRLRELMETTNTTQQALADILGFQARQSIAAYMDGTSSPDFDTLINICKCFNVSADWLLGLSAVKKLETDLRSVCEYSGLSESTVDHLHTWCTEEAVEKRPDNTTQYNGDHSACIKALEILVNLPGGNKLLYDLIDFIQAEGKEIYTLQAGQTTPVEGYAFFKTGKELHNPIRIEDIDRLLRMRLFDDIQSIKEEIHSNKVKGGEQNGQP